MDSSLAIEADRLCKTFGRFHALNGLSLNVKGGIIFGLLGPNGAGKTTLLRTLLGYIRSSSGAAYVFGNRVSIDCRAVRKMTAYLPAEAKLFRMIRGSSALDFFSSIHPQGNKQRALAIADRLELDLSRMVAFMSTGMRQKLAIACVLAVDSRLLILDEPTANLDPNVRQEVLMLIREAHGRGTTVVLSSHIMDEIEDLCDSAAIIKRGAVAVQVELQSVRQQYSLSLKQPLQLTTQSLPIGLQPAGNKDDGSLANSQTLTLDAQQCSLDSALRFLYQQDACLQRIEPLGLKSVYEACSPS